jgi:hypothetical protein
MKVGCKADGAIYDYTIHILPEDPHCASPSPPPFNFVGTHSEMLQECSRLSRSMPFKVSKVE